VRVIEQSRLWFREGTSDKVFEIDLVEVATNQYVVNFRHGRRGSALKDGTKTALPLSIDRARVLFGRLVDEKKAGGYQEGTPPAAPPPPVITASPTPPPASTSGGSSGPPGGGGPYRGGGGGPFDPHRRKKDAILTVLRLGPGAGAELGRAVWHAGDYDLTEAEPLLRALFDKPAPKHLKKNAASRWWHTVLSALVRCGTRATLPLLERVLTEVSFHAHEKDIARVAIARIDHARGVEIARSRLPATLLKPLDAGSAHELAVATEKLIGENPTGARSAVNALFLLGSTIARPAILAAARVSRLENAEAQIVRMVFRMAEVTRDGELYVRVARRIDAYTGGRPRWDGRGYRSGPFGEMTRLYFRRRTARVLRRLARAQSADYAQMASAWLLGYTDEDAGRVFQGTMSRDWYDAFAKHHTLNDIIYGQSPRYRRAAYGRSAWKCTNRYRPGSTAPAQREERYPKLWDAAPDALWRLVAGARATVVLEFATKALRANRPFIDNLDDATVARVLGLGHLLAQQFVFEMIQHRPMNAMLARGALSSQLPEAHAWVLRWVSANPDATAADPDLVALLVTGRTQQVRDAATTLLTGRTLPANVARSAAHRSLAILLALDGEDGSENDRAAGAARVIVAHVAEPLKDLPPNVLRDMIAHPLSALGELAGEIMLRHDQRDSLPADLLESLLASPHAAVRAAGARILATMPPEIAKDDPQAIILFATSANAELREHTRSLVGAIAKQFPDVGRVIADRLIDALMQKQPEGAPAHIVTLLRNELANVLPVKPPGMIMRLINAFSPHAREAGGLLLGQLGPDDLGLDDIARLANHEILAVRQGAWRIAKLAIDRYRVAQVAVSRLVDSQWEDTRTFAMELITELGTLSADAIIAICDSIKPEVQALGKQLLFAQFTEANAGKYLVRLSEHPSTNLQLLVSGLLEHHLQGDLVRLQAIVPYLVTVLSQVNRGRIAKERVMALVRREAVRTAEGARILAPLLDRQSATIAITQKHPLIQTMVEVHHVFPEVPLPITVATPPSAATKERE
jgi:hypothetical protein